jgi:hypothetical protein
MLQDDTVEGATVLIEKIGHLIDEHIEKARKQEKKEGADGKPTAIQKYALAFQSIFKRFEDLQDDQEISLRIRILVKNMLDNRATGWERTKRQNEKGPKKVEELRRELEQKAIEEEKLRQ